MSDKRQLLLPMKVAFSQVVDDLEMGILQDGRAYLSGRSLAKLCGVYPGTINQQGINWRGGIRQGRLAKMLEAAGITRNQLHFDTGTREYGYTDDVCIIFLEYYAYEATPPSKTAARMYRQLSRAGIRAFIYHALGKDPLGRQRGAANDHWSKFQDRFLLNSVPSGYFSVFQEMAQWIMVAAQKGLKVDEQTVPDISIGSCWAKHWKAQGLAKQYGEHQQHPHVYPDYFPQARAQEDIKANVYPSAALGEFRVWMETVYIPEKFPEYLAKKVPADMKKLILAAVERKKLAS